MDACTAGLMSDWRNAVRTGQLGRYMMTFWRYVCKACLRASTSAGDMRLRIDFSGSLPILPSMWGISLRSCPLRVI